jgi:hypothetical protein
METSQSYFQDIQTLRRSGYTHRAILMSLKCRNTAISQSGTLDSHSVRRVGRSKKIAPEISSHIKTLSRLDAAITDSEIPNKICERSPDVAVSGSSRSNERIRLGFHCRSAKARQDLDIEQQQRIEFATSLRQLGFGLGGTMNIASRYWAIDIRDTQEEAPGMTPHS